MLQTALIPLYFNEATEVVADMCRYLTNFGTEKVFLLHVGSDRGRAGSQNHKRLSVYARAIEEIGLETQLLLKSGSIQIETIKAAEMEEVDYISIPFKKRSWLTYAILGSHVKDVIRQADIPVFVYKLPQPRETADDQFRVLFAASLRGGGGDDHLVPYIKTNDFHADQVVFLHTRNRAPDPVVENERQEEVQKELESIRIACGLTEETGVCLSVLGSPRKQIVKVSKKLPANLVLLGKSDAVRSSEPVLGSTAEEVSYNAPCSVLIVPKKEITA